MDLTGNSDRRCGVLFLILIIIPDGLPAAEFFFRLLEKMLMPLTDPMRFVASWRPELMDELNNSAPDMPLAFLSPPHTLILC